MEALSNQWRQGKSSIMRIELAQALLSLRKIMLVEGLDPKKLDISSDAGESYTDGEHIAISLEPILKEQTFPTKDKTFDALVGVVAHEIAHIKIKSPEIEKRSMDAITAQVASLGEEILADSYYKGRLGEYLKAGRVWYKGENKPYVETPNTMASAFSAMSRILVYGEPVKMSPEVMAISQVVLDGLKDVNLKLKPDQREDIYREIGVRLGAIVKKEQDLEAARDRVSSGAGSRIGKRRKLNEIERQEQKAIKEQAEEIEDSLEEELGMGKAPMDSAIVKQVQESLDLEETDVTEVLANLVNSNKTGDQGTPVQSRNKSYGERPTITLKAKGNMYIEPDKDVLERCQFILQMRDIRRMVRVRHLESGKVDSRNIWKVGMGETNLFREKHMKKDTHKKIYLTLDGSSSMSGQHGDKLYAAAAAFQSILKAKSWIYTESHKGTTEIELQEVGDGAYMHKVDPYSGTPSGNGLLFGALQLHKDGGGVLIHFTDGYPNTGIPIETAFDVIEKEYPDVQVVNIVLGQADAGYHRGKVNLSGPTSWKNVSLVEIKKIGDFAKEVEARLRKEWGV